MTDVQPEVSVVTRVINVDFTLMTLKSQEPILSGKIEIDQGVGPIDILGVTQNNRGYFPTYLYFVNMFLFLLAF